MRRSKIVLPVHLVWATYGRLPLIQPEWEAELYDCIRLEATKLRVPLLAIGGVENHVHVVIQLPATRTVSEIVKQLKGVSSRFVSEREFTGDGVFKWQEGYGAFGFHTGLVPKVVGYVENQRKHHHTEETWPALEATDEEVRATDTHVREDAGGAWIEARDFNPSWEVSA